MPKGKKSTQTKEKKTKKPSISILDVAFFSDLLFQRYSKLLVNIKAIDN